MNDDEQISFIMGLIVGGLCMWLILGLIWMFLTPVETVCGVLPRAYDSITASVYEGNDGDPQCYVRYVGAEDYILFEAQ